MQASDTCYSTIQMTMHRENELLAQTPTDFFVYLFFTKEMNNSLSVSITIAPDCDSHCCRKLDTFHAIFPEQWVHLSFFDVHEKIWVCVTISVRPPGCVHMRQKLYVAISPHTINMINAKLCLMIVLIDWALPIHTFSVTLIVLCFKVTAVSYSFSWKC